MTDLFFREGRVWFLRKKLTAALLASTMVLSGGIGNLSVFNEPTAYVTTVFAQYVTISTTPKVTTTSTNTSVTLKCAQC